MFDENEFDVPSGEVSEPTTYFPIEKGKYIAKIEKVEYMDRVLLGWTLKKENPTDLEKREFATPFVRVHWRVQADEFGQPCEAVGRQVNQEVSLLSGPDQFGRSRAKGRADLIRLKNNLTAKDDVMGQSFYTLTDLDGLDRKSKAAELGRQLTASYAGLQGTIIVAHRKPNQEGEVRDFIVALSLPKE